MQFVWTEMRVPSRHLQTLVPQQVCDVFQRSALHTSRLANVCRKSCQRKFLIPASITAVVKSMPPVFKRFAGPGRLEHTAFPAAPVVHNPQGGNRSII